MSRWVETVERVIAASPEQIFALVADPRRHQDIDGSGTVRDAHDLPERLTLGATFGMNMDYGGPYSMTSTIIEFEEGRRIAWQSRPPKDGAKWRQIFGGRTWRYELEPVEDGTRVKESWDLSQERFKQLVIGYRKKTRANMKATLARIDELVTKA